MAGGNQTVRYLISKIGTHWYSFMGQRKINSIHRLSKGNLLLTKTASLKAKMVVKSPVCMVTCERGIKFLFVEGSKRL
jgi:hypothetical protein